MKAFVKSLVVSILTTEAKLVLRRTRPTIIAVTGSVGKTSTKDAIYAAIRQQQPTRKSQKSFNSEFGLPLTILGLQTGWSSSLLWLWNCVLGAWRVLFPAAYPAVLVLEIGVDHPGDMKKVVAWLPVDIAVVTSLPAVPVHVEFFASPAAMRDEEFSLVEAVKPDGVVIYNVDEVEITNRIEQILPSTFSFGRMLPADVKAKHDEVVYHDDTPIGMRFELQADGEEVVIERTGVIGLQGVYAVSAAVAVATKLGIPPTVAALALQNESPTPGRMRLLQGIKSTILIDDTYNASPVAAEFALETLGEVRYAKRKIAVLGDMLELGSFSAEAHREVGVRAAKVANVLFTVGPRARGIAQAALESGMDEAVIFQYETAERAGRELQTMLQNGDVVLVKASQGIRAERIVKEVMQDPEAAAQLLVRQEDSWQG